MSKYLTPLKAIRKKCLDCSCFQSKEVDLCPMTDCTLYPFRYGRNVKRKGMGAHPGKSAQESRSEPSDSAKEGASNGELPNLSSQDLS